MVVLFDSSEGGGGERGEDEVFEELMDGAKVKINSDWNVMMLERVSL
jgi:hypothetical protein